MHLARLRGTKRLHYEFHPMLLLYLGLGRRQIMAIQAGRSVDMVGDHQPFQNRSWTSREDTDIRTPRELQDLEGIEDGMIQSDVSCGGYKAEDL